MQFNSFAYLGLLAGTIVLFQLLPRGWRAGLLLAASVLFYAAWSVPFVGLLVLVAWIDWVAALRMQAGAQGRQRRAWLALAVVANLAILAVFKYGQFLLDNLHLLPGTGFMPRWLPADILLPLAISFHTFQAMGYAVDVYRGEIQACRSFPRFLLFVIFFPQLVAGPIERARRLLPQLEALARLRVSGDAFGRGALMVAWGLFQKCALADNLAVLVEQVYGAPAGASAGMQLLATYAFTLQLYFDFAGYTDIARGSARMLGIELVPNFKLPFLARNPRDIWRRWHVSLSEWFRDYLYRPLGGNRRGDTRTLCNLALTMALAGLWHGAAWHFMLWGLYHGALLVLHRLLLRPLARLEALLGAAAMHGLAVLVTFHLWAGGLVLFRAATMADALTIYAGLASGALGLLTAPLAAPWMAAGWALLALGVVLGGMLAQQRWGLWPRLLRSSAGQALCLASCLVGIALLAPEQGPTFIYFQF